MNSTISVIKGIHPGIILERELKKRNLTKVYFANSIGEYPQTLVAVIKGRRKMNPALSLKIEKALDMEEGYFMVLQAYYDIKQEKKRRNENFHPDLSKFRPVVFWDTKISGIDWEKNKPAVIRRIFERGNEQEIKEIIRFYGKENIESLLKTLKNLSPSAMNNSERLLQFV